MIGEKLSGIPEEATQKKIRKQPIIQRGVQVRNAINLGGNEITKSPDIGVSVSRSLPQQPLNTDSEVLTEYAIDEELFDPDQYLADDDDAATNFGLTDETIKELSAKEDDIDQDPTAIYLQQIRQYPLLNPLQIEMIFGYMREGVTFDDFKKNLQFFATIKPEDKSGFENVMADSQDLKQLVTNCNLRLVVWMAKKYQGRGWSLLELIQEGNEGLIRSLERFDPDKGRFSTYAGYWIRQSISRAIANKSNLIRLPVHMFEKVKLADRLTNQFLLLNGHSPSPEELHGLLVADGELSPKVADSVIEALQSRVIGTISLDKSVGDDKNATLGDFVKDKNMDTQEEGIKLAEGDENDELSNDIRAALENLERDEKEVTELGFGLVDGNERSLDEIAAMMSIQDKEQISAIQQRALRKLRREERLLERYWSDDPPSYLFRGMSAERAAFALGLFDDGPSFIAKAISDLPFHLKVFFDAKVNSDRSLAQLGANRGRIFTKNEDDYYFNLACIRIWESMATSFSREDLLDPGLRRDIYGRDQWRAYFDPGVIRRMYLERKRNIADPLDHKILSLFLGLENGKGGFLNARETASQLELDPDTVITRLHQSLRALQNTYLPLSQLRIFDEGIRKLREEEGLSYREVAEKLGATLSQVKNAEARLVNNEEVVRQNPHSKKIEKAKRRELQIARLRKLGLTNPEIARKLGMSESGVSHIVSGLIETGDVISRLLVKTEDQAESKPTKRTEEEILIELRPELEAIGMNVSHLVETNRSALKSSLSTDNLMDYLKKRIAQLKGQGISTRTVFLEIIRQCSNIEGFMQNVINLSDYGDLLGVSRENMRQLYEKLTKDRSISLPPKQERAKPTTPNKGREPLLKSPTIQQENISHEGLELTENYIYQLAQRLSSLDKGVLDHNKVKLHTDDQRELGKIAQDSSFEIPEEAHSSNNLQRILLEYIRNRSKVVEANIGNENALFILGILADVDSEDQVTGLFGSTVTTT